MDFKDFLNETSATNKEMVINVERSKYMSGSTGKCNMSETNTVYLLT